MVDDADISSKRQKRNDPTFLYCGHAPVVLRFRPAGKTDVPKKLEYFCLRALGEPCRLLLEATETPYDSVLHFSSDGVKSYAPFGQMPLYHGPELGGIVLAQTAAICHHIARTVGAAGDGHVEQARVHSLFELSRDLDLRTAELHAEPEIAPAEQPSRPTKLKPTSIATLLEAAERHAPVETNFWVGHSLTLADTSMFCTLRQFTEIKPGCLKGYPKIQAFTEAFARRPAVAAYLASDRRVPLTRNCLGMGPYTRDPHHSAYLEELRPSVCAELYKASEPEDMPPKGMGGDTT